MPGQVPNSNFPGSGVSMLSTCFLTARTGVPFRYQLPGQCRIHMKETSELGSHLAEALQLTERCCQHAMMLQRPFC